MEIRKQKKDKKIKTPVVEKKFEDRKRVEKLFIYISIVRFGQGETVVKLMESMGSSVQLVQVGKGTANEQIKAILNIADDRKDVVFSVVKESLLDGVKEELTALFASSKRSIGIAFAVPLSSLVGVKMYKFLTRTL